MSHHVREYLNLIGHDNIRFNLQSERALNIIEDRSRRLLEALEEGREFEEMAFELEATFEKDVTLDRLNSEMDIAVLNAIFQAKKPSGPGRARLGSAGSGRHARDSHGRGPFPRDRPAARRQRLCAGDAGGCRSVWDDVGSGSFAGHARRCGR